MPSATAQVSLFIPCLVDQVYPEMGLALVRILEHLGYRLEYNPRQTCCGQPAFNAGHRDDARRVASQFLDVFAAADTIVCPSGSCTAMVRKYYPVLFAGQRRQAEAESLSRRVFEFSEFLVREERLDDIRGRAAGKVGFHNSCHSYRELGLRDEGPRLLRCIAGVDWVEAPGEPVCCGFGGLFSVKHAAVGAAMASARLETFVQLGVQTLVVNDPGCIMHLRQEARARQFAIEILYLAEFLERAMFPAAH